MIYIIPWSAETPFGFLDGRLVLRPSKEEDRKILLSEGNAELRKRAEEETGCKFKGFVTGKCTRRGEFTEYDALLESELETAQAYKSEEDGHAP